MIRLPRLYAIADATFGDPVQLAEALFKGGARLVQVRNKTASSRELLQQVERILGLAPAGALVIVNDRVDIALISNAAGVHLGQSDLPVEAARDILGQNRIVGLSTHNLEQALQADVQNVDYIAVGPVFQTSTKVNPEIEVGLAAFGKICESVSKPVVAIGGIRLDHAKDLIVRGTSVAVIRDLLESPDITGRTREWLCALL